MYHVQYHLSNGEEISYICAGDVPTMEDTNQIALMVAQKRPDVIPDSVFINVRLYGLWMASFNSTLSGMTGGAGVVPSTDIIQVWTTVGPLRVVPKPWACDGKLFLIGREDDFERYDIDLIFEKTVLRDCERGE